MSDTTALVESYLQVWNETDPTARRAAIQAVFTEDATYTDPLADVAGIDGIDAVIGAVQAQFEGMRFSPIGLADAHHHTARFGWALGANGSEPLVIGFDVAVLDEDGRIRSVYGFLDKVPAVL
jgi:hypothetical protein